MAKKRGGKTVVRGADGALYLLSKTGRPVKLTENQTKQAHSVIKKLEGKLKAIVADELKNVALGCNQNIKIIIPDVHLE
jgi:hypothetical protein